MDARRPDPGQPKRGSANKTTLSSVSQRNQSSDEPTSYATTRKSLRPQDRAFGQHLIDHDVFPVRYRYPDGSSPPQPENIDAMLKEMAQSRRSLSPSISDQDFETFLNCDDNVITETDVMIKVMPLILGPYLKEKVSAADVRFNNLKPLTDGKLARARPDLFFGDRPETLNPRVREELNHTIIPSTGHNLALPNFFLEVKGPGGSSAVALQQACYNGALGARGMQSLRLYSQPQPEYDNKAYTISSTYHSGTLRMYASHPIPPRTPDGKPGYAMTQIRGYCLNSDVDSFRQGVSAFRNAMDWAERQRDVAIEQANKTAAERRSALVNGPDVVTVNEASGENESTANPTSVLGRRSRSHASPSHGSNTSPDGPSPDLDGWSDMEADQADDSDSQPPRKKARTGSLESPLPS
ncbi:hypothetical protein E4U55_006752 [Claviceps digitariae]|nr:hypothetical protein E4U55_006752 [Claviceps digitariae]